MTLVNAHALFVGLQKTPSYLASLEIEDDERQKLKDAQLVVRTALRDAAHKLKKETRFWRDQYLVEANYRINDEVNVKFLTQGSFAYKTLNAPAQPTVQEIDLDDGMYIPVRFLKDNHPALAANGLFAFVEETLRPICAARSWTLDKSKNTCVRIKLWPGAHIDIPIYSVPEQRFRMMKAAIEEAALQSTTFAFDSLPPAATIRSDLVMLAQRNGNWIQSDPKQLHDWVNDRVERHGPVYRRLCRFFKGWRDHIWKSSPLSSICLMCAIDAALLELGAGREENRDDEQILEVARLLPQIFSGEINNPVVRTSCLNDWCDDDRRVVVAAARELHETMERALERTGNTDLVIQYLREAFGKRIPNRPDIVKITGRTAASVRAATAAVVPTPDIASSDSG